MPRLRGCGTFGKPGCELCRPGDLLYLPPESEGAPPSEGAMEIEAGVDGGAWVAAGVQFINPLR